MAALVAGTLVAIAGCGTIWKNLTKARDGNVTLSFTNTTVHRAAFSYGSYDAWDRTPGAVELRQLALAGQQVSQTLSIPCGRNLAIATERMIERATVTEADETVDNFEPDMFSTVVHFSDAPSDSDAEFLPTVGTANGIELMLGRDYSCEDTIFFTFVEDPDAEGGFRIDYEVILNDQI